MDDELKWRQDDQACIVIEPRLIRWTQDGVLRFKVLQIGSVYVENTDYIPIKVLNDLPVKEQ